MITTVIGMVDYTERFENEMQKQDRRE